MRFAASLWVASLVLLFAGCSGGAASPSPQAGAASRTGLLLSDIHFNPLADPKLANTLARAPAAQWDSIFATSTNTAYSQYGSDTNFPLLQSALTAMRQRDPNPDVVIISGDFLVHFFQYFFNSSVTSHSPATYAAFVNTTEQYLALKFSQTFPRAQILPALGNVDSACGAAQMVNVPIIDYAGSGFLASFASAWEPAVNRYGGAPTFRASFSAGGYYATTFPIDPRGRLLVLDTQPWSGFYEDACGPGGGTVGDAELAWLTAQLEDARSNGQRVWLLGHIPPGVAPAAIAPGPSCPLNVEPFYAGAFSGKLYALFAKYRGTFAFGVFGHTHNDDFRVARDSSGHLLFGMKILPPITPVHSTNPAFVQFTYDPSAGIISDATTWILSNIASASAASPGIWNLEYDFDAAYGQNAMDSNGVAGAVTSIQTQAEAQSAYTRFYAASSIDPNAGFATLTPNSCALSNLTVSDYSACYCGH